MGLTYAISVVNWMFGNVLLKKCFLMFFNNFKLLMFPNNIVKISEISNEWNLLKIASKLPTLFYCSHFYYGIK